MTLSRKAWISKFIPLLAIGFSLAAAVPAMADADANGTHELVEWDWPTVLWILGLFIILLIILQKTAWKNVLTGLKNREERIRKDIADAEDARVKAEATLREYASRLTTAEQQVREIISKGSVEAEKIAAQIKMNAQKDAEEAKDRATKEIEATKRQALAEIYEQTANLATSVAEKILRRSLDPNDQRDLVQQSLEQLPNASKN